MNKKQFFGSLLSLTLVFSFCTAGVALGGTVSGLGPGECGCRIEVACKSVPTFKVLFETSFKEVTENRPPCAQKKHRIGYKRGRLV